MSSLSLTNDALKAFVVHCQVSIGLHC